MDDELPILICSNSILIHSKSLIINLNKNVKAKLFNIFKEAKWFISKPRLGEWSVDLKFDNYYIHIFTGKDTNKNMLDVIVRIYKIPKNYDEEYILLGSSRYDKKSIKLILYNLSSI